MRFMVAAALLAPAGLSGALPQSQTFTLAVSRAIQGGPAVTLQFHGSLADAQERLDVAGGSDSASFPPGGYILVADTAGWFVLPADKQYVRMGAGAAVGGIVDPFLPQGAVSDVFVLIDSLGPGETIDGHTTRRYQITAELNVKFTTNGSEVTAASHSVIELWQADIPGKIPNPFLGLNGNSLASNRLKDLDDKLSAAYARLPGVTVRSVTNETLSAAGRRITNSTVTTEISAIRDAAIDKALVTMPAGYTLKQQ